MRNRSRNSPVQENFQKALSDSLHQMAQPLSIIQASLELALLRETTGEAFREVAENVLHQLSRAGETLRFTSQLTRYQQPATDVTSIVLSDVLHGVIADLSPILARAQVKLAIDHSGRGREREIQFSQGRLHQLFFYILQAMQHRSQPGDIVHIGLQAHAGNVRLRIFQTPQRTAQATPKESDESLPTRALALAEAIATSAGAEFRVINSPLLIIADFPIRRQTRQHAADKDRFERTTPAQFAAGPH